MNKKLFVPFVLAALTLSGCGTTPAGQNGGTAPVATKPAGLTYADAPAGCPKSTTLTAKTSDLKETTFSSLSNWFKVYSATPDSAQLVFSTYNVPKDNTYITHEYTDKDALVVVSLKDTVTNKVGVGNFSGATDAKIKVVTVNVSSKELSGGVFDKNGQLEITNLDSKYACGTMKFDDGTNSLKGDFIAEVNNF